MEKPVWQEALRGTLLYAGLSIVWSFFADRVIAVLIPQSAWEDVRLLEGWLFIVLSSAFLYVLLTSIIRHRRLKEEELTIVLRQVEDAFWITDANLKIIRVNDAACRMTGHSEAELLQMTPADFLTEKTGMELNTHLEKMSHAGAIRRVWEVKRKDGVIMFVEVSTHWLSDGRALAISHDVTRQQEIDAALKRSLQSYHELVDSLTDWIWEVNVEGTFQFVSGSMARGLGYSVEQLIGRAGVEFTVEGKHSKALEDRPTQIQNHEVESSWRHKDGSIRHVVGTVTPLLGDSGQPVGYRHVAKDMTEWRETIAHSDRLQLAISQSSQGVVILNEHGQVDYINPTLLRMTGLSYHDLSSQIERFLSSEAEPAALWWGVWGCILCGTPWQSEFPMQGKLGEISVKLQIIPVKQQDGVVHALSIVEDMTEHNRMVAELRSFHTQLQDLVDQRTMELAHALPADESTRAKKVFLANMSHEIRTPINVIMGLTHLMQRKTTDEQLQSQLSKVNDAITHLLGIVNNILDLSKIEADKIEIESVSFTVSGVIHRLKSMMSEKSHAKGLSLSITLDDDIPPLKGDPVRVSQALLNLAENAVKFTHQGGLTISIRRLTSKPDEILLRFEVRDTGIGISADDQRRLFQSFHQADGSTTRKYGGSGLGLVITQHLARKMGGEVGVTSELGVGSTFWFTARFEVGEVFAEPVHKVDPLQIENQLREFSGTRILVVDDEPVNREVTATMLNAVGLEVVMANNGKDALAKLETEVVSLILMDVQMPEMDGLQATRILRQHPHYRRVPILAMTANAFVEDQKLCLDAGMDGHISKPVFPQVLFSQVLKWLSGGERKSSVSVDVDLGVQNLFGQRDRYFRLLQALWESHHTDADRIATVVESQPDVAYRMAHSLKGASGMLCAFRIQDISRQLEKKIQEEPDQIAYLCKELHQAMGELRQLIDAEEQPTRVEEQVNTSSLISDLKVSLKEDNLMAYEIVDTHQEQLKSLLKDSWQEFYGYVKAFEYPAAIQLLEKNFL